MFRSASGHQNTPAKRLPVLRTPRSILPPAWRNLTLLRKFGIVSFLLITALGVILAWVIQDHLEQNALSQEAWNAADQVSLVLEPNLTAHDFSGPLSPARLVQIDALVHRNIMQKHVVRVKFWAGDGTVLYSDDPKLINRKFDVEDDLGEAFGGHLQMDVSSLTSAENIEERLQFDRLMEIYVPLHLLGQQKVVGVVEVYHDLDAVQPRINDMRNIVWGSLALGFLILFGSLFTLVRNASRSLTLSSVENARLYEEASASLLQLQKAQAALRESESSFRQLFANNPLPLWLYDLDTLQFLQVNQAAVEHYGYSHEEFLNMRTSDIRHPDTAQLDVEERAKEDADFGYSAQARHTRRDGSVIDVQITAHTVDLAGRRSMLVVAEDITERKRAEVALVESEKRFRTIFSGAAIGMALVGMDGKVLQANPSLCDMLGYTPDELYRKTFTDITYPDDVQLNMHNFRDLLDGKIDHYHMEKRYVRKDGAIIWANLTTSLIQDARGGSQYIIGMVENITGRKQAEAQVQRQFDRLAALRSIDLAITASVDLRVTLAVVLDNVMSQLGVDAADVLLLNAHTRTLEYASGRGFRAPGFSGASLRLGDGYAGRAALERRTLAVPDIAAAHGVVKTSLLSEEGFKAYFVAPLISKGQVQGVLELFKRVPFQPDKEWFTFFEALAGQAAIAVDNSTLFDHLQKSNLELSLAYDTTLEGWSRALDLRDKETEGHTRRVTEKTMRLARAFGVGGADMVQIRRGALLHDIGKMGIPDSILLKPGPLTDKEWEIMRKHPVYAYELLSPIPFLRPALDIPYCHHEKWDGSGYPRGLKGEQIPLAARLFAAVDVWDALRSDRPYRPAWSEERVREHIRSLSGTHFDPDVVRVFLETDFRERSETGPLYVPAGVN